MRQWRIFIGALAVGILAQHSHAVRTSGLLPVSPESSRWLATIMICLELIMAKQYVPDLSTNIIVLALANAPSSIISYMGWCLAPKSKLLALNASTLNCGQEAAAKNG